jgi:hypothetical protein
MKRSSDRSERGQIVVLFAGGLIAIILGVGLIVDVGFAWAQQRNTQNGADAASRAGALVLAQHQADSSNPKTGTDVWNAITATAAQNGMGVADARYTDWQGNDLPGNPAVVAGSLIPAGAAGVRVDGTFQQETFLIRVVGINTWLVRQSATAVAGPTNGCFETVEGCNLLPIAFPVTIFACTDTGKTQPIDPPQAWASGELITLPLCGGNPGSVGWLDWDPPSGGTSELVDDINNPPDVSIALPSWNYVTETGDISALTVENAINEYAGEVVLVPMFDSTCDETPTNNETSGCPAGHTGGAGVNQWYHVTKFLSFQLDDPKGAFINGNNEVECGVANAKECLRGAFVSFVTEGPVGAPCPPEGCSPGTAFAVQLIK